jgi:hypothetical protein
MAISKPNDEQLLSVWADHIRVPDTEVAICQVTGSWSKQIPICLKPGCQVYFNLFYSVAKGPKFQPQSSKMAEKNFVRPGKSGAELLPDLSKKGRKGAELF